MLKICRECQKKITQNKIGYADESFDFYVCKDCNYETEEVWAEFQKAMKSHTKFIQTHSNLCAGLSFVEKEGVL